MEVPWLEFEREILQIKFNMLTGSYDILRLSFRIKDHLCNLYVNLLQYSYVENSVDRGA